MTLANCVCGAKAELVKPDDLRSYAACTECGIRSVMFIGADDDEVIENWNSGVERTSEKRASADGRENEEGEELTLNG